MELRRIVGKLVLLLAGAWVLVLVGGIGGAARGASLPAFNLAIFLTPGCAFVPATFYAIKLHTTTDPELSRQYMSKTLIYGVAGLVLLLVAMYGLFRMENS